MLCPRAVLRKSGLLERVGVNLRMLCFWAKFVANGAIWLRKSNERKFCEEMEGLVGDSREHGDGINGGWSVKGEIGVKFFCCNIMSPSRTPPSLFSESARIGAG